jgi:Arc/MetJ-type ribon-helix-helix transcriptional regulator
MTKWKTGIALPLEIVTEIDKRVEKDKYPKGKYFSRTHFVIEAVKEKLRNENTYRELLTSKRE